MTRVPVRPRARTVPVATLLVLLPLAGCATAGAAPPTGPGPGQERLPTIAAYTSGMDAMSGYFPLYWDAAKGRLLLEVGRFDESFLYLTSLATGIGSNEFFADRSQIVDEQVARFRRVGPRVLLELENPRFRAATDPTEALERSVTESFPTSVIGGFEVVAEEGERVLVDATSFFLRDAVGVAAYLRGIGQGTFRLDGDRSAIHLPRTEAFPENTEVEAALTFAGDEPGGEVRRHTPDGRSLTLRQHHSLVKLPGPGYEPRGFDPRVGIFSVYFYDFGKSFDQDYVTRLASRHRLVKRDPGAAMSEPVEPIIYYLDPAVPEPYRSAFKEGGQWWNEVFEAAGFIDAFRIEDMPPDMDPMDARYNVIQWVHRTEAGSSVGPSFRDPRTGEIIKAAVRMDSYRSLANYNTYAGLVGVDGDWFAGSPPGITGEEYVMARRRQHSAHEIGHTLGLAHNFIAASYGRASVMDYPVPLTRLTEDGLDLSDAYRSGAGAYDTLAVRYAYQPVPEGETEASFLNGLLLEAQEQGWRFLTNPDARASNAYPAGSWWVNGTDMVAELDRVLEVRSFVMDAFDERAIREGEPMHKLWQRFAPVYFHHRATYEAAIKTIGGMEYRYGVRGDPAPVTRLVGPDRVGAALDVLTRTLAPENLAIPERVLQMLAPESYGWVDGRTEWETAADPAFDQVSAARTLASEVVGGILNPARAARVVAFHARDPRLPSLEDVIARLVDDAWDRPAAERQATMVRVVQHVVADELIALAANDDATPEARAAAEWGLRRVLGRAARPAHAPEAAAHRQHVATSINRFLERGWGTAEPSEPLEGPGWARDEPDGVR
ncbi:MAG: zinc-dependent metalloprotease [Longimicrobiales bacterium]|nr:zinc-dependent metalloprotease [Longimicrobiales bacterium]